MHAFDRRTDRQTDRILIVRPRLHSMQRGKNVTGELVAYFKRRWLLLTGFKHNDEKQRLGWSGGVVGDGRCSPAVQEDVRHV